MSGYLILIISKKEERNNPFKNLSFKLCLFQDQYSHKACEVITFTNKELVLKNISVNFNDHIEY